MPTLIEPLATRHVTMHGISWNSYVRLRDEIGDGPTRITFDNGSMEITMPSDHLERVKKVLARLIEAYADATNTTLEGLGSTTFQREDLQQGLEPDECYYAAHAGLISGIEKLDLKIHPAPDLAIEIDLSPPDVAKTPIYGAMGVAEIWRYKSKSGVEFLARATDGTYKPATRSITFPNWPAAVVNDLLLIGLEENQTAAVAELRRRI